MTIGQFPPSNDMLLKGRTRIDPTTIEKLRPEAAGDRSRLAAFTNAILDAAEGCLNGKALVLESGSFSSKKGAGTLVSEALKKGSGEGKLVTAVSSRQTGVLKPTLVMPKSQGGVVSGDVALNFVIEDPVQGIGNVGIRFTQQNASEADSLELFGFSMVAMSINSGDVRIPETLVFKADARFSGTDVQTASELLTQLGADKALIVSFGSFESMLFRLDSEDGTPLMSVGLPDEPIYPGAPGVIVSKAQREGDSTVFDSVGMVDKFMKLIGGKLVNAKFSEEGGVSIVFAYQNPGA